MTGVLVNGALVNGASMQGRRIRVRGQVQGVGFRPFIWQLAQRFDIRGEVLNDPQGVLIHGYGPQLDAFVAAIDTDPPPLARIDAIESQEHIFAQPPVGFQIVPSRGSGAETRVTPDAATCPDCLADIRGNDPRRRGYAFTNCTHCGPRFTILTRLPYDRARTTMARFEMCAACAREYADPADRRFHAQPVACATCGPQLWFEGQGAGASDAIATAARTLAQGGILAVKGLGGFHLCCDATNAGAIATLRSRKQRPDKPLALMGRWSEIDIYATLSDAERDALSGAAAPIVLLDKAAPLPDALAPGQTRLGWMLPYTPLHHLLLDAVQRPLVMTSGNLSGEPQVIDNSEARDQLGHLVDGFLLHDRDIARRLDDSVMQITPYGPMILRRARGLVPDTLPLPPGFEGAPQVVAYGAHLKSAICLIKNGQALLSHHLGDLDDALTWDEFVKADADYAELFDHHPEVFACDLHPDYRSSHHAAARAGGAEFRVQHHHAHHAACLAENAWPRDAGPVAGIILDGLGLGQDRTIWGGEVLLGDYHHVQRHAWLDPAPLPGGDAANRDPWRNLLARLPQGDDADAIIGQFLAFKPIDLLRQAMAKGINAPLSSSVGRLFDAVAALVFQDAQTQSYEGAFAMRLESIARGADPQNLPLLTPVRVEMGAIDPSDMMHALTRYMLDQPSPAALGLAFHHWIAEAFAAPARALVASGQARAVALSGGCFQNALLLDLVIAALGDVPILTHTKVPANDGGLALGQAVIAAAKADSNR